MTILTRQECPVSNFVFMVDENNFAYEIDTGEKIMCPNCHVNQLQSNEGWFYCFQCEREQNREDY